MGYVLTVYNEKRYREFFLSEQDRAEQELLLLKQEFSCGETVRVRVKKTEAGWQLLDGATYTVWKGLYWNHLAGAGAAPTHLAGSNRGSNADPKAGSGVLYL